LYIRFKYSLYVLYIAHICCRWNEYTPFTSFHVIQVSNRVFSSTILNVALTYTHIVLCTVYEIKPLFISTNWIRVLALDIQLISGQDFFEVWRALSYWITVLALVMKLTCAHNGHQLSKWSIFWLIGRSKEYLC
jgi:hypothetical protein